MNDVVVKEAKVCESRWSNTKYFDFVKSLDDKTVDKSSIALLLENQRLINESSIEDLDLRDKLLRVVSEVYPRLIGWKIISIQPMVEPKSLAFYVSHNSKENVSVNSVDMVARTRKLEKKVALDFGPVDLSYHIVDEIDGEVLTDLWNNRSIVGCIDLRQYEKVGKIAALRGKIAEMLYLGSQNSPKPMNWMVVNDDLHRRYSEAFDLWNDISIYPHRGVSGVLMGYKGESYMDSKYVYSPYVPFTLTPLVLDPFTFKPRQGILTRYGKYLIVEGSRYYAGFSVIEEEN